MPDSPPTFSDAIAANVRAERARLQLTQEQLGKQLGMSGATVSDIETGRRIVSSNDLPLFCKVFDIPLSELARRAAPADLRALGL